jgi:carboxylate-amine ligase
MENKWHAVRYGTQGKLIDFGISEQVDFGLLTQEILSIVNPVLDEINIRKEIQHIQQIVKQGTSAKQQIDVYEHALQQDNCNHEIALQKVVDYLAYKTVSGL